MSHNPRHKDKPPKTPRQGKPRPDPQGRDKPQHRVGCFPVEKAVVKKLVR